MCRSAISLLLLLTGCATVSAPPRDLGPFVDAFMEKAMREEKIPGAVFVFVHEGKVVYAKGYGLADVERHVPVTPDRTIWRIGSITKAVTATAVMQLVERGQVDLDRDVNHYLHKVQVPATYPRPITVRDLLDHTSGLDEIRPGTQAASASELLPLAEFLRPRLVRVRPPGEIISYSTYGMTLAGLLIEEVSGLSYGDYLARNIWSPLGMRQASLHVPAADEPRFAVGYEMKNGVLQRQAWEWYHTAPASSMNATALEMAAFIRAHLGGGAPLLRQATEREMQRQQITMHPKVPGYALGFEEDFIGGVRVIMHGGNMSGLSAQIVLVPQYGDGFFVAHQFENSTLRNDLKWELLEHLYPEARTRHPVPPNAAGAAERVKRFAGRYIPTTSCHSCSPPSAPYILTVTANDDGTLTAVGNRYVEVEPGLFMQHKGSGYIVFRDDKYLFAGGSWSWEKISQ
jgi:CubicO group peptidase (beta-lactamase class C family)